MKNFAEQVREITGGEGVPVVYDAVGQSTFEGSLASLKRRGLLVSFGQSSGPIAPFTTAALAKGSLFLTRPGLADYTVERTELLTRSRDLFAVVESGGAVSTVSTTPGQDEQDSPTLQGPTSKNTLPAPPVAVMVKARVLPAVTAAPPKVKVTGVMVPGVSATLWVWTGRVACCQVSLVWLS